MNLRSVLVSGCIFVAVLLLGSGPVVMAQADVPMPGVASSPEENPTNPDQVLLGKFLFWEEQMSTDNTMACGTCHIHEIGGSDPRGVMGTHPGPDGVFGNDDDVAGSPGVVQHDLASSSLVSEPTFFPHVQATGRKSPTAINSGFFDTLFWDGRASGTFVDPVTGVETIPFGGGLESQAAGPPLSSVEMSALGETWLHIASKIPGVRPMALATDLPPEMADHLGTYPTYPHMFMAAYGDGAVTPERIIFAIANYERTLVSDQTPLDEFLKGNTPDLGPWEAGFQIFNTVTGNCVSCHVLPFTADDNFHNIGVRPDAEDTGREGHTGDPADRGKFKTPNIRNAALRTPLFHNGGVETIEELVKFYDDGGAFPGPNLDVEINPLNLTAQQQLDLIDFLKFGVTDQRVVNREFPFTRPTLRSEMPPTNSTYGVAGVNANGTPMEMIAHYPANIGNPHWLLGVTDATPNQVMVTSFAFTSDPAGTPLPDRRFPVPMNVVPSSIFLLLLGATDGTGVGTTKLNLPYNTALVGMSIYSQVFVSDPGALATGGVYGSEGVEIGLF
ncbi:MAG: cytochrome-c peroxidase [Planctomycetota bacterium]|nr:cytochrome-c peroxidase [Planctomycetota bacterium]